MVRLRLGLMRRRRCRDSRCGCKVLLLGCVRGRDGGAMLLLRPLLLLGLLGSGRLGREGS
jgi:hypothetical protein